MVVCGQSKCWAYHTCDGLGDGRRDENLVGGELVGTVQVRSLDHKQLQLLINRELDTHMKDTK